jgi:hypothetical protein
MNRVDFLLKSPFSMKTLDEKMRIKELGPHQPQNIFLRFILKLPFQIFDLRAATAKNII